MAAVRTGPVSAACLALGLLACGARTPPTHAEASPAPPLVATLVLDASLDVPGASDAPPPADGGSSAVADAPAPPAACPDGMVLVAGDYCPNVRQTCKRWVDPPSSPYPFFRCAEYEPSVCTGTRVPERFCIDKEEYVRPGDPLPLVHQSWTSAGAVCAADGKRLCLESEWQFACEGEDMHPYPYGDGLKRDATACNIDQTKLGKTDALLDLRAPVSAYPGCMSPFGVHDMSGNVEEWATVDKGKAPNRSTMKGAWWLPGKNTCRAATLGHGEIYQGAQVGVRCCEDAR